MDSSVLGTSWFAKPIYSEMGISSILILSSKFISHWAMRACGNHHVLSDKDEPLITLQDARNWLTVS